MRQKAQKENGNLAEVPIYVAEGEAGAETGNEEGMSQWEKTKYNFTGIEGKEF